MDCVACDKCRLWGKLQVCRVREAATTDFSFSFFISSLNIRNRSALNANVTVETLDLAQIFSLCLPCVFLDPGSWDSIKVAVGCWQQPHRGVLFYSEKKRNCSAFQRICKVRNIILLNVTSFASSTNFLGYQILLINWRCSEQCYESRCVCNVSHIITIR